MLGLEADTGGGDHHGLAVDRGQRAAALGRLDGRACAPSDILPCIALVVLARGARAGRAGTGLAVVFAGERNAEALVLARLRRNRAGVRRSSGQRRKDGSGREGVELVHVSLLELPQQKGGGAPRGQRGTPRNAG